MDDAKLALFYQLGELRVKMNIFFNNLLVEKNKNETCEKFQELMDIFDYSMRLYIRPEIF